jgi:Cu/Ag efflux protein CusF
MGKIFAWAVTSILTLTLCGALSAQSKTFTRESKTITGTIEAIDTTSRTLTIKESDGNYETMTVPEEAKRFSSIKVGDKITVRYYDNVIIQLKPIGEKSVNSATAAMTPGQGPQLAGTVAKQRTITATIEAIDPKVPSVTLSGPNKWRYSSRIQDKDVLKTIKVGDRVDVIWTEAALVSFETPQN